MAQAPRMTGDGQRRSHNNFSRATRPRRTAAVFAEATFEVADATSRGSPRLTGPMVTYPAQRCRTCARSCGVATQDRDDVCGRPLLPSPGRTNDIAISSTITFMTNDERSMSISTITSMANWQNTICCIVFPSSVQRTTGTRLFDGAVLRAARDRSRAVTPSVHGQVRGQRTPPTRPLHATIL